MKSPTQRVLVTRSAAQASALADLLRSHHLDPILIPSIELTTPTSFEPLDTALAQLDTFHWLLFTSANAVEAFHHRLQLSGPPQPSQPGAPGPDSRTRVLTPPLIAAIGPATARALQAIGLTPTLIPPQAIAESLAETLLPHALQPNRSPTSFLLIRAEEARDILPDTLRSAGAHLTIAPAYRTILPSSSVHALRDLFTNPESAPAAITFTSSSTATNFFTLAAAAGITLPPRTILASIGPITSATLAALGHPATIESSQATVQSLVEILVKTLSTGNSI